MKTIVLSLVLLAQLDDSSLWQAYIRSIYNSAVYQRSNVRQLYPMKADAGGNVLVTTFTPRDGKVGDSITVGGQGMWVTIVPEVQTICRGFQDDVLLHLRELLGLPPNNSATLFLVLRAKASDIFRPSPNADPTISYPCAVGQDGMIPNDCGNTFPDGTTPAHYQWIATQTMSLHSMPNGYPWTHLGYTYNWDPSKDRYGASEYVIRPGSSVVIVSKAPAVEYCK